MFGRLLPCSRRYLQVFIKNTLTVKAADVQRWWPVGMGEQKLYDLSVAYVSWSTWNDLLGTIGDLIGDIGNLIGDIGSDIIGKHGNSATGKVRLDKANSAAVSTAAAAGGVFKRSDIEAASRRRHLLEESEREWVEGRDGLYERPWAVTPEYDPQPEPPGEFASRLVHVAGGVAHAPQFGDDEEQQREPARLLDADAAKEPTRADRAPQFPADSSNRKQNADKEQREAAGSGREPTAEQVAGRAMRARMHRMVAQGKVSPMMFPGIQQLPTDDLMSAVNRKVGFRHVEVRAWGGRGFVMSRSGGDVCGCAEQQSCSVL